MSLTTQPEAPVLFSKPPAGAQVLAAAWSTQMANAIILVAEAGVTIGADVALRSNLCAHSPFVDRQEILHAKGQNFVAQDQVTIHCPHCTPVPTQHRLFA